jgi:hypothetical protein
LDHAVSGEREVARDLPAMSIISPPRFADCAGDVDGLHSGAQYREPGSIVNLLKL